MTQEIEELNRSFNALVVTAFKQCEKLPDCVIDDTDITFFNGLVDLALKHKAGEIDKGGRDEQGRGLRTKYIEIKRARKRKKFEIKRAQEDYITAETTIGKLLKEYETLTTQERECLYLVIVSLVEEVSARLIKEKAEKAKEGTSPKPKGEPKKKPSAPVQKEEGAEGKVVAKLILKNGAVHCVYESDVKHYKELYPDVDVVSELRKMQGWCESNPSRRKTPKGVRKYISSWLSDTQTAKESAKAESKPKDKPTYDMGAFERKGIEMIKKYGEKRRAEEASREGGNADDEAAKIKSADSA